MGEVKPCSTCGGNGHVPADNDPDPDAIKLCPTCNGTGWEKVK